MLNEQQTIQKLDILIEFFNNLNLFFDNIDDTRRTEGWGD